MRKFLVRTYIIVAFLPLLTIFLLANLILSLIEFLQDTRGAWKFTDRTPIGEWLKKKGV